MNSDFCYCNGYNCPIKETCVRYVDGLMAKKEVGVFWWMESCDDDISGYVPT